MALPDRADGGYDHGCHTHKQVRFSCFYLIASSRSYPHMVVPRTRQDLPGERSWSLLSGRPPGHPLFFDIEYSSVGGRERESNADPTNQLASKSKQEVFLRDKARESREMCVVIRIGDCFSGRLPRIPHQQGYQHQTQVVFASPTVRILSWNYQASC